MPCLSTVCRMMLLLTWLMFCTTALAGGGSWSVYSVNCNAPQQHALHRDADGTLWAGCGTGASGFGVYRSQDGGQTWQAPTTIPANFISTFRINDIKRGHDGALYLAGTVSEEGEQHRVIRLDTSTPQPYAATATLIGVPVVGRNFTVGHYAELDDGSALASSLTSADKLYRPDATTGNSAADWLAPTGILSFTQLLTHGGGFYASGSRINLPPRVFLPPQSPTAEPWEVQEVILDSSYNGEIWGVAVNDQRVVAAGIDQDSNQGKIYVSTGNPYNPLNYTVHEFRNDGLSWAHGVCMRGDRIAVVGRRLPSGARVLQSTDGGVSFSDISPSGSGALISRCVIAPDGLLTVFGSGGFIGVWDGMVAGDAIFADRFQ